MNAASVIGNNSWKFHDDTMMGAVKMVWQTDGQTDGSKEPLIELLGRS